MLIVGALLTAIVLGVFAMLFVAVRDLRSASRDAARAERVAAAASTLERLATQLESDTRGYVISGHGRFLAHRRQAAAAIPAVEQELRSLVYDDALRRREQEIERAIETYLTSWARPIARAALRDRRDAARRIAAGGGERRIAGIRARFDDFVGMNG